MEGVERGERERESERERERERERLYKIYRGGLLNSCWKYFHIAYVYWFRNDIHWEQVML